MKIGFACKMIDNASQVNGIGPKDECKKYNVGTTTAAWLNRQSKTNAEQRLYDLMKANIESVYQLVKKVSTFHPDLRMVRIGSDVLPLYTEDKWSYFWQQSDVRLYCERAFLRIGDLARETGVRLSMHPGQYTVLGSDDPDIVTRGIADFEYHTDMVRWMGYGQKFQDFKINIHVAGRQGHRGMRKSYSRLSPEARNCITVENEEMTHGLDACLALSDIIPTVLDIHHQWIREGEYIQVNDDRIKRVIDSWRGVRPTIHYSVSREDVLIDHCPDTLPDYAKLIAADHKKTKLRAHSDFYWNRAVNEWALTHTEWADMMCESKAKNLASFALYQQKIGV